MILWSDVEKHQHDFLKAQYSLTGYIAPGNTPQALGRAVEGCRARYEYVPSY